MQKKDLEQDPEILSLMREALSLALLGKGNVSPNPMVGAIIVKDGKIIGKGYHQIYGGAHAEVEALNQCQESAKGATLICTLEPCCHTHKQTPPCVDRIIKEGIKEVIFACTDPNPSVSGKGAQKLREAGVSVKFGVLEEEAKKINEKFFKFMTTGLPFVHLKVAQTLDGQIATARGDSQWITSEASRKNVHELRAEYDAILVGSKTAYKDNPQLNVRYGIKSTGPMPYRVVLGEVNSISLDHHLFSDAYSSRTLVFTRNHSSPKIESYYNELKSRGVQIFFPELDQDKKINLKSVLQTLASLKVSSVLVEGGSEIYTSFLKEKLVDKITVYIAPRLVGHGKPSLGDLRVGQIAEGILLEDLNIEILGHDIKLEGRPDYRHFRS